MFKLIHGKRSSKKNIEQARLLRVDQQTLNDIKQNLLSQGSTFSVVSSRSGQKLVYPGDLSAEGNDVVPQTAPLVSFEYKALQHTLYVKEGLSGEVLMMLVRELNDEPFHTEGKAYMRFGGATEGRLWCNGRPVGVNYSETLLDVAPVANMAESMATGASLVELVKQRVGNSVRLFKRKGDGSAGIEIGMFTRVRNGPSVFNLVVTDLIDPLVALTMAWYNMIDEK